MSLRTKNLVSSIQDIPREWVFEHYLELSEKLTGQDIKMKSVFNDKDKKPSLFVFWSHSKRKYLFKDFSTDRAGDGTELVKELFNLSTRGEAAHKIIEDYNNTVMLNGPQYMERVMSIQKRYKVVGVVPRNWNQLDKAYWTRFKIGSDMLIRYNVQPLESYRMGREDDDRELFISHPMIYGFFRKDGTLYKIYQPKRENKFVKVQDYIQGMDQLTFTKPYLVICASLKDVMAFNRLEFNNAEAIAPDSENVMIPEHILEGLRTKYKAICTLLDNDAAGIRSMRKYEEEHEVPYAHLKMEKDLSDSIKDHGIKNVRIQIFPLLTKALTGQARQL